MMLHSWPNSTGQSSLIQSILLTKNINTAIISTLHIQREDFVRFIRTKMVLQWLAVVATILLAVYFGLTRRYNHWKNKGVVYMKPIPFFGNALDIFLRRKSVGDLCAAIYKKSTAPMVGMFLCDEPCLVIRDLDLIKTILIKDFDIFDNRSVTENKKDDPMGSHILFILKNPDWRNMRRKITQVFTSGKMKLMYNLIRESGAELLDYLDHEVGKNTVIETRELSAKYTTDTITSTSFGINANCFKNEDAEFRQVSRRIFNWSIPERAIATMCYFVSPTLVKLFRLQFIDRESSTFLRKAFWNTIREREISKHVRNDLLDILLEIKRNEKVDDIYQLEGDKLVAQATQFFIAGYETTSSTITFALYELARHPAIQTKLRNEVIAVMKKHGAFCYDALKEMDYLNLCVKETLRKYPILPFLDRRCNKDYKIPKTDIVLEKGTAVFVPVAGLHYDPQYYPNPEAFMPERFLPENEENRPKFVYLPFGDGPRNCIGSRFALLSSKSMIAHLVSNFKVDICQQTQDPLTVDPRGFLLAPREGLYLRFSKVAL